LHVWHKLCTNLVWRLTLSPNRLKRASTRPTSPRSPISVPKMIFEPIAHLTQIVHQSCVEINTISKRTKMSLHLTYVTWEVVPVWPKRFPCMWYVWRKPCTYLSPRLTASPSGPKHASTWTISPRSSIECTQNNFWAYCMFGTNGAPILFRD
jgi:hypothetical protein